MSNKRKIRPVKRPAKRRRVSPFTLAVAVVVLGGVAAVVAGLGGDDVSLEGVTAPVEAGGSVLPEYAAGGSDDAVGDPAPAVSGEDFAGSPVVLPGDGPQAIVFLAHWCPHCQAEVEALTAYLADHPTPEGVRLVSVSTLVAPRRGNFPPDEWLDKAGWPLPVLVDDEDSSVATAYGLSGTPFWVFVDGDGTVAERASGEMAPEALFARLERLAAGS
ncbi:MAG: TlpA family protein disulfide reductase [Actinobacteria bacterium]|nr:TlpA family protein disulfide reductase [Actinomycetota bacterium]